MVRRSALLVLLPALGLSSACADDGDGETPGGTGGTGGSAGAGGTGGGGGAGATGGSGGSAGAGGGNAGAGGTGGGGGTGGAGATGGGGSGGTSGGAGAAGGAGGAGSALPSIEGQWSFTSVTNGCGFAFVGYGTGRAGPGLQFTVNVPVGPGVVDLVCTMEEPDAATGLSAFTCQNASASEQAGSCMFTYSITLVSGTVGPSPHPSQASSGSIQAQVARAAAGSGCTFSDCAPQAVRSTFTVDVP